MKVKLLEDAPGSPDGFTVNEYAEGNVYDVTDSLGAAFVANGLAEETDEDVTGDEPVVEPAGADDDDVKPSSNKKAAGPSENK